MIPGEYQVKPGQIAINIGRATCCIIVENHGDRPIQVGSHYHFAEVNPALKFDRQQATGYRLNIAAGTAVRFEPGQKREVEPGGAGRNPRGVRFPRRRYGRAGGKR